MYIFPKNIRFLTKLVECVEALCVCGVELTRDLVAEPWPVVVILIVAAVILLFSVLAFLNFKLYYF